MDAPPTDKTRSDLSSVLAASVADLSVWKIFRLPGCLTAMCFLRGGFPRSALEERFLFRRSPGEDLPLQATGLPVVSSRTWSSRSPGRGRPCSVPGGEALASPPELSSGGETYSPLNLPGAPLPAFAGRGGP